MNPIATVAKSVALTLLLGGCQHGLRQPVNEPAAPSAAVAAAEAGVRIEQQLQTQGKSVEDLSGRLTLVQEQVIKSNQNLSQLQQRAQQQLVALQQLQMLLAVRPEAEEPADNGALEQLVLLVERLEQLSTNTAAVEPAEPMATGPEYRLVSTYTDQGVWVIFKYDAVTGLTWRADGGRWVEVEEPESMPVSRYELLLRQAHQDVKGYVAARIDQHSGQVWWLNGNRWAVFQ